MSAPLHTALAAISDELIALRHDIHRWPEPGFEEVRTQAAIMAALSEAGLSPRACAGTGVVVDIGSGDGPCLALRADIDCLRMTEANPHLPYRSERDGLAHMCGHDGHTATLVGAGILLAGVEDRLPGRIRLLFQPAEEGPGGAPVMIEAGCLEGVDEVYGMHNWPAAPLGALRTISGPCMATVAEMSITVTGKGVHASQPQDGQDPVLAAAHIVTALQSIISRNVHYQDRCVVSVTTIHGGEAFNVIPDTVTMSGTIRALSEESYDLITARIEAVATGTATAMGCSAQVLINRMYPVLVNTPKETALVESVARAVFGTVSDELLPMLGAEDFAFFLQHRPGCFFFLGGGESGRSNAICHATNYDYNDNLIDIGVRFWLKLIEARMDVALFT
ncbi:MAG: amidohydrolase [Myxococcota bacterium]|nr:amidohydrolase [Myxococcota bacterium]